MLAAFAEYGDREAIVRDDERLTYADLRAGVLDVAAALRDNGVRPGTCVAVLVWHPAEAPVLQLALHLLGCRSAWVDANVLASELVSYLDAIEPEVLVCDPRTHRVEGAELSERLGVPLLCLGPGGTGPDLLEPRQDRRPFDLDTEVGADPESLFHTSGTTGLPKLLRHREDFYQQIHQLAMELRTGDEWDVRHLTVTRLSYVAGQISALLYLFCGGVLVIVDRFEPGRVLAAIQRHRASSLFIAPPMFYQLLDHPDLDDTDISSLKLLSVGASAATPTRLRQGVQRFGPVLRITYGLSESPFITAYPGIGTDTEHPHRLRSCGQAYGDVRIEIRDESGNALGVGQTGEVWVSSRLNFAGYWGQPALTEQTLVDGWLRTRDLGQLDADGFLYLVGRTQDTILTGLGSVCIYPRPIEDVLTTHPEVHAAAVIGVPDPDLGEVVHAYVVLDAAASATEEELTELVRNELNDTWAPRAVQFVDSLPVTGIGKVNTKALRARYMAEH